MNIYHEIHWSEIIIPSLEDLCLLFFCSYPSTYIFLNKGSSIESHRGSYILQETKHIFHQNQYRKIDTHLQRIITLVNLPLWFHALYAQNYAKVQISELHTKKKSDLISALQEINK